MRLQLGATQLEFRFGVVRRIRSASRSPVPSSQPCAPLVKHEAYILTTLLVICSFLFHLTDAKQAVQRQERIECGGERHIVVYVKT